ncbi:MAG TPA: alpha/beta fold hydrolase [Polyangiaceae bacterium]|nr:alpha/beta fold hydrolase [Polyangiaceae bacterium]
MGLGMRGVVWSPQTDVLASDHRLITFDNRGIGGSETAPGEWTMADMAGDALRVLDAAGWTSAHVVGVSMGGMIAQELALRAPERLRSLTLIATHAGGRTGWVPPFSGIISFLEVNLLPADQRFKALAHLLYPRDFLRLIDRDELAARMGQQVGSRASAATRNKQIKAVMRHDTRARLVRLETPTMVIISAEDKLVDPRRQYALAEAIPNASKVVFDRAGHGVIFQCARVINGHIARHVAAHEPLQAGEEDHERVEAISGET